MANEPLQFGQHYHIYNRGNNRENLFVEPRNYPYFLGLFAKHIQPVAKTYAYCLLPTHFHFFVQTRTEEEQKAYQQQIGPIFKPVQPSRAFNNMFIAYARAFNKATQRTGKLFESPFGRKLVDSEAYFLTLIAYIHRNPQKHGLVRDFRDWKWSSYSAFLSAKPTKLQRNLVLDWFGGIDAFLEMHETAVDENLITAVLDNKFEAF